MTNKHSPGGLLCIFAAKVEAMLNLSQRLTAFVKLGLLLKSFEGRNQAVIFDNIEKEKFETLKETVKNAQHHNGWFVEENVRQMLAALGESLEKEKLEKWVSNYLPALEKDQEERTIAVVMAGNIPVVGFHDFLSVLLSGNKLLAKLSSDDEKLLPAIADLLASIEPAFKSKVAFTNSQIKDFDAVIATGSDNSSRYFQYYFGKYPNIIRKNRNGVAVLKGDETAQDLEGLADDIFSFYGLGCRNVSKIFVPDNYDFNLLLDSLSERKDVIENHKYFNNYEYNKAIFLVNTRTHFDAGTLLLVEEEKIASPVSVLHYEYYNKEQYLHNRLTIEADKIQCVISGSDAIPNSLPFGKSQQPELWDYADGVDTMAFLLALK